ncbi:uncharacterized protein FOMMEDRAFT_101852 [Fomitiporia mediterranea MF3/22]|uniref:uncharacterized protein n=1 Tax=Fomitiporia mediterranea (strain MF3/22) TaxID=694068 RepID=UPI0004407ADE|nr:uncharacterized protein FOMMEDRAFT_101852 [Fomitiporia mediterranea MF3/22]EJD08451.1 hypothetical protein FOMMEDRAFT_101852 [Fomitiporia mediterranea MF3/22]
MASPSCSSPSASSSAVTLPRPGKSILKKAPPPQQSFLSRLSRLLPSQNTASGAPSDPDENLKRAHFFLPHLATVYPISAANPPCSLTTREEKRSIEAREAERRRRIVRGNSYSPGSSETDEWWSTDRVESFYKECCTGREEQPHPGISAALKKASGAQGRSLDLSGVQITPGQAATLSDVFSVEWGLRKLFLKECDLDEHNLKPILHALLIPGTLNFLSIASNRRLKAPAFRLIGAFVQKAKNLQFLDLSQNFLDKKSVECVGAALKPAGEPGLVSLRMDDCSLRPASLETLAQNVRTSSLRNISLRHNRISASGAVALALMIKDYPDTMPAHATQTNSLTAISSSNINSNHLFSTLSPPSTPSNETPPLTPTQLTSQQSPSSPRSNSPLPPPTRQGPIPPPPIHPANAPVQTTYTPYIPRAKRAAALATGATAGARALQHATRAPNPLNASGQQVPIITSSAQGGITTRHPPGSESNASVQQPRDHAKTNGPSAALLDKVRALDALPRLGELRTLDLRGNDIRAGIQYIAQVLKRNRTLKVLNLSENKIDVQGLVAIAEALKYNLTLETLDMGRNPCSGPALDGIQSLRTAFTLNTSLKRLFLASTSLTSAGAIALAEFLPESASLLHLDLTLNSLDLAAVMALSGGLKANHTMRCLDLNIPPDDEEFARMCRDILNTCIRNTEEAERTSQTAGSGRGMGKGVWGMIEESELAKTFKKGDEKKVDDELVSQAKDCLTQLEALVLHLQASPEVYDNKSVELVERSKAALVALADVIQSTADPIRIEELFYLNDSITIALTRVDEVRVGKGTPPVANGHDITSPQASTDTGTGLGLIVHPENGQFETEDAPPPFEQAQPKIDVKLNGLRLHIPVERPSEADESESGTEPDEVLETPKVDKGKGRAAPEPEVFEKVLSPSFVLSSSDDEEDEQKKTEFEEDEVMGLDGPSPVDLCVSRTSKVMVEEEGEVFRKGNILLGPDEMEGEYDGEELRIELLEAEVQRPPPRALNVDEFGMELPPLPASPLTPSEAPEKLLSPTSPHEQNKPPPRPYLRRSRSSSSVASPVSTSPRLTESAIKGSPSPIPEDSIIDVTSPMSPANVQSLGGNIRPYISRRRSSSANSSANSSPVR